MHVRKNTNQLFKNTHCLRKYVKKYINSIIYNKFGNAYDFLAFHKKYFISKKTVEKVYILKRKDMKLRSVFISILVSENVLSITEVKQF